MRAVPFLLAVVALAALPAAAQLSAPVFSPGLPTCPAPAGLSGALSGGSLFLPAPAALSPGGVTLTPILPSPAPASRVGDFLASVPAFLSAHRSATPLPQPQAAPQVSGREVQGRVGPQAVRPSRPGFEPHAGAPYAVLPDGSPVPPDSYLGGYYGTHAAPDEVVRDHGFPARGPLEDWRIHEHSEEKSEGASAFRGTTVVPAAPESDQGAVYWADEGGWVYEVRGVPTWDVNSTLEGRVQRPDGTYRGNLMHGEVEHAVPAQLPIECIPRWGQVRSTAGGRLYVPTSGWVDNPAYDVAVCARFFARG